MKSSIEIASKPAKKKLQRNRNFYDRRTGCAEETPKKKKNNRHRNTLCNWMGSILVATGSWQMTKVATPDPQLSGPLDHRVRHALDRYSCKRLNSISNLQTVFFSKNPVHTQVMLETL